MPSSSTLRDVAAKPIQPTRRTRVGECRFTSSCATRTAPLARAPRTTGELLSLLRADDDYLEHQPDTLAVLLWRSGSEEFDAARALARSASALDRVIAADILAQFGWDVAERLDESVAILIGMLSDPDERVLRAVGVALGHRRSPVAIPALLGLASHPRLLQLQRTEDADGEVRGEALIGLAARRDPRVLPALRHELAGQFCGDWCVEAAELLADASLRDALLALRARLGPADEAAFATSFDAAIKACSPGSPLGALTSAKVRR
nr:HEAT repeat domain-containing protein [Deltaproteobacteria bacterium]